MEDFDTALPDRVAHLLSNYNPVDFAEELSFYDASDHTASFSCIGKGHVTYKIAAVNYCVNGELGPDLTLLASWMAGWDPDVFAEDVLSMEYRQAEELVGLLSGQAVADKHRSIAGQRATQEGRHDLANLFPHTEDPEAFASRILGLSAPDLLVAFRDTATCSQQAALVVKAPTELRALLAKAISEPQARLVAAELKTQNRGALRVTWMRAVHAKTAAHGPGTLAQQVSTHVKPAIAGTNQDRAVNTLTGRSGVVPTASPISNQATGPSLSLQLPDKASSPSSSDTQAPYLPPTTLPAAQPVGAVEANMVKTVQPEGHEEEEKPMGDIPAGMEVDQYLAGMSSIGSGSLGVASAPGPPKRSDLQKKLDKILDPSTFMHEKWSPGKLIKMNSLPSASTLPPIQNLQLPTENDYLREFGQDDLPACEFAPDLQTAFDKSRGQPTKAGSNTGPHDAVRYDRTWVGAYVTPWVATVRHRSEHFIFKRPLPTS